MGANREFVRVLQKMFAEKNIFTSTLIMLSSPEYPLSVYFFLGVTLKKPLLQTVIMARVEGDRVSFELKDGRPNISTTHHVISSFLHRTSITLTEITVEAWDCSYKLAGMQTLVVTAERLGTSFILSTQKKSAASKKPPVHLPFGLSSLDRKKRKKRDAKERPGPSRAAVAGTAQQHPSWHPRFWKD